jgi:antirestriction protein ArdC
MHANADVYEAITKRMMAALERGTVPWRKPWSAATGGRPRSMSTREPYKGINTWLLALAADEGGYRSPWWGTFNQIADRAGMERRTNTRTGHEYWASPDDTPRGVRKGEKGTQVVLWKTGAKKEINPDTGEKQERQVLLARFFYVFNAEQADGLPDRYYPGRVPEAQPVDEIRAPQDVLDAYVGSPGGPQLRHVEGDRAYFSWHDDMITLPERRQFRTSEGYYATALHEAVHSTGHRSRLAREAGTSFSHGRKWGDPVYAREELIAEMGSTMLRAETGIETGHEFEQSADYIKGWLGALEKDPKLVPQAAAAAQRAVDLVLEPQRQAERQVGETAQLEAA